MLDSSSQLVMYGVVQYFFDEGKEVHVVLPSHGNAKHRVT